MSRLVCATLAAVLCLAIPSLVVAQPSFDAAFAPTTMGPGSHSVLTFDVSNASGTPVTDIAFTNVLPAGMTLGPEVASENGCEGSLVAPEGGSTITLTGGRLGAFADCRVAVWVTATSGTLMNVSGDLTSSAGNSGTASADLSILSNRLGVSAAFTPSNALWGGEGSLTITLDGSASGANHFNTSVSATLPAGMTWTDPADVTSDCVGSLFGVAPGGSSVQLGGGFLIAGQMCTITGSVQLPQDVGAFALTTTDVTTSNGSGGRAIATIDVATDDVLLDLDVVDDPAVAGGSATLDVRLLNRDRFEALSDGAFTLDLDAALPGLVAVGLPATDPCGAGSTLSGTSLLTLSGANIAAEGECSFAVTLLVPAGAAPGRYLLGSSTVTATRAGSAVDGLPANAGLTVGSSVSLSKTFVDDPVADDGSVTVEYTLTNSGPNPATDIAFVDPQRTISLGIRHMNLTAPCNGTGTLSQVVQTGSAEDTYTNFSGGSLAAGASCTFIVVWQLPGGISPGLYPSPTEGLSATVSGVPGTGPGAEDTLEIVAAPRLTIQPTPDRVSPGSTVSLEYTLRHGDNATADALGAAFAHDLSATAAGIAISGTLPADPCGPGTTPTATAGGFSISGIDLSAGESCTFAVDVDVPMQVPGGQLVFTTDAVTATSAGVAVTAPGATAIVENIVIDAIMRVVPNPVVQASLPTIEITLDNLDPTNDATAGTFTVDLSGTPFMPATAMLPAEPCGVGSQLVSTSTGFTLTGGVLPALGSCTIEVPVQVGNAADGDYPFSFATSTWTIDGATVVQAGATGVLTMANPISQQIETTPPVVYPGETVDVTVTVLNASTDPMTAIASTLDFSALDGAVAGMLPSDPCGAGSTLTDGGNGTVVLADGSLAASSSCTFTVPVVLPASVPTSVDATVVNRALVGVGTAGTLFGGDLAVDVPLRWVEMAIGPIAAIEVGDSQLLPITLTSRDSGQTLANLRATVALPLGLQGFNLPEVDVCGMGSTLAQVGDALTLSGASLAPGGSCMFSVGLGAPAGSAVGTDTIVTSPLNDTLRDVGLEASTPGEVVAGQIAQSLSFSPEPVPEGQTTQLRLDLDNAVNGSDLADLSVAIPLPAGLSFEGTPSTTCGTPTFSTEPARIAFTDGSLTGGATCTVLATVRADASGSYSIVTENTLAGGIDHGPAMATLQVAVAPLDAMDMADMADLADATGADATGADATGADTADGDVMDPDPSDATGIDATGSDASTGADTSTSGDTGVGAELELEAGNEGGSDGGCCTTVRGSERRHPSPGPLALVVLAGLGCVIWRRTS